MKDIKNLIAESKSPFEFDPNGIRYHGKKKCYACINTANYDADGVSVMLGFEDELEDWGFNDDDIKKIKDLNIDDSTNDFDTLSGGVVVVRLQ